MKTEMSLEHVDFSEVECLLSSLSLTLEIKFIHEFGDIHISFHYKDQENLL